MFSLRNLCAPRSRDTQIFTAARIRRAPGGSSPSVRRVVGSLQPSGRPRNGGPMKRGWSGHKMRLYTDSGEDIGVFTHRRQTG